MVNSKRIVEEIQTDKTDRKEQEKNKGVATMREKAPESMWIDLGPTGTTVQCRAKGWVLLFLFLLLLLPRVWESERGLAGWMDGWMERWIDLVTFGLNGSQAHEVLMLSCLPALLACFALGQHCVQYAYTYLRTLIHTHRITEVRGKRKLTQKAKVELNDLPFFTRHNSVHFCEAIHLNAYLHFPVGLYVHVHVLYCMSCPR